MIKRTEAGAEISKSTVVRGRVQGAEPLSVAGRIEGSVTLDARLTIEKSGVVKADVEADEVIVRGILVGDVRARRAVRIEPGARVKGDVEAPSVVIAEGAQFSGGLSIGDPSSERIPTPRYEPERVQAERAASESERRREGRAWPGPGPAARERPAERPVERPAPAEVIMRPVVDDRHRRRVVVKKRS